MEPRRGMKRHWAIGAAVGLMAVAAAAPAIQNAMGGNGAGDAPIVAEEVTVRTPPLRVATNATPMAQRMATLGLLNKRNGLSRDLRLHPGQAVHIGDAVVRLRACDQSEPWEKDQLTGAFVQLIVHGADDKWRKVFSGWLFKETPSLNVVEHPIYDVWVKACTMRHPETGPNTVVLSGEGSGSAPRSKAKKSPEAVPEPPAVEPTVNAASSDAT